MRSLNDIFIPMYDDGSGLIKIDALSGTPATDRAICPESGTLTACFFHILTEITTLPAGMEIFVNGSDTGAVFSVPAGIAGVSGEVGASATVSVASGDTIHLVSDGAPGAGAAGFVLVLRR